MKKHLLALSSLILLVACGRYGGRAVRAEFITNPPGAEAFLIPLIEWDRRGRDKMLSDLSSIKEYRIGGSQLTPFKARVGYHEQVLVCIHNNHAGWMEVSPNEGDVFTVQINTK